MKLFPKPDDSLSIPISPESSLKKVEIERMLYPPYMPFGCDGPQITMLTAELIYSIGEDDELP